MEKNGRNLCIGNYQHADVRYLFVKYRVDQGEFKIQYCLTEIILEVFQQAIEGRPIQEVQISNNGIQAHTIAITRTDNNQGASL